MGPWGAIILSFFGATFFTAAIVPQTGWRTLLLLIPCTEFLATLVGAVRLIRTAPGTIPSRTPHAKRVMARATAFEAIAIPVLGLTLANTGHPGWMLPGIALIVGLHFLPMAYALPVPRLYPLAAALIAAAILGVALPAPLGWLLCGLAAAVALWLAALAALLHPL